MKQNMTLGQLTALLDAAEDRMTRPFRSVQYREHLVRAVEKLRDGLKGAEYAKAKREAKRGEEKRRRDTHR